MSFLFSNNAISTLAAGISGSDTSITVAASSGALFPTPTGGNTFRATLIRASDSAVEIVDVTAKSGDVFTVVRAKEGTTGLVCLTGDKIQLRVTAEIFGALQTNLNTTVPTNGLYLLGTNSVGLATGGAYRVGVDAAGQVGIGAAPVANANIYIQKNLTGGVNSYSIYTLGNVQSDVTAVAATYVSAIGTAAGAIPTALRHFYAIQGTFVGVPALQEAFNAASSLIGATNNVAYRSSIPAGTGRYALLLDGGAQSYVGGDMQWAKTVTAGGTTGAQTINKTSGTVNFAAAATSLVVTNSLVSTASIIVCTVATADATMKSVVVVAAAGSFTITANAAATAETRVNFLVFN